MRVVVDRDRCQSHGRCYSYCPEVFVPDDHGYATVASEVPQPSQHDAVRRAAAGCPEQAIVVTGHA